MTKENVNFPKVVVIVLNWNNYNDTAECIHHLEKLDYPNFSIVILDNHSVDGSAEKLKHEFEKTHTIIINSENLGYTGGNNVGMKVALNDGADYMLVLNNDTLVKDQLFLNKMIEFVKDKPNVGLMGPRIASTNGKLIFTQYYSSRWWSKIESKYSLEFDKYGHEARLSSRLLGAALLINVKLINKIGMFDESFFMYSDEDDLALRAIIDGFDVVYFQSLTVYRKTEKDGMEYNVRSIYYTTRNKVHMLKKNLKGTFKIYMLIYNTLGEIRKIIFRFLRGNFKLSYFSVVGLIDGLRGTKGLNDKIK
ncbi:glycosyltransferase family 2 protein [Sporolactobacillus sp. STSJ-5]|uniref:glycosyltransferase family 2 protein n=1 Tax=Sporolactobacillus sp. STSJ-5 TaxID=2965076 RepID=UPI002102BE27|nr:glycosyltransferase family 2 protein [Sporolactobacillus sp. STSJ-5]MCQ2009549.1 glycosyltransferase family 2 protein [Sporolactobacillus sp. STSJ-5]